MLTKAFKKLWIAALKGGNYTKGRGCLRSPGNKCCCLGVAADLLVAQGKAKWLAPRPGDNYTITASNSDDQWCFLPDALLDMIRLTDSEQRRLARINDRSTTFTPVIDAIKSLPTRD